MAAATTSSSVKEFADRLKQHVDGRRGISNTMLHEFATHCVEATERGREGLSYRGTFSSDKLPPLSKLGPTFCLIVNLQRSDAAAVSEEEGERSPQTGHFVVLAGFKTYTLFVDPFGMRCTQPQVRQFAKRRKVPFLHNESVIQHHKSVFCGLFCILFVLYFHVKPEWELQFSRVTGVRSNEQRCMSYLNKLLGK